MAVKRREYLFSVNRFHEPQKVEGQTAIALLLVRLILLQPGSDPLHPDMGVGIRDYRYSLTQLEDLRDKIAEQINMFLPDYQNADVNLILNGPDRICNIEITIDDTTYVYDSSIAPVPVRIADIQGIDQDEL